MKKILLYTLAMAFCIAVMWFKAPSESIYSVPAATNEHFADEVHLSDPIQHDTLLPTKVQEATFAP